MQKGKKIEKAARGVAVCLLLIGIFVGRQSVVGMDFPAVIYSYMESVLPAGTEPESGIGLDLGDRRLFLEEHVERVGDLIGLDDIIFQFMNNTRKSRSVQWHVNFPSFFYCKRINNSPAFTGWFSFT